MKILVVENDQGVLELLVDYFSHKGYSVVATTSAEEALRIIKTTEPQFNLVITANQLPGMKGFELIQAIKKRHPGIHIFFMSGYWNDPLPEGIDRFYSKPFDVEEMNTAIERLAG